VFELSNQPLSTISPLLGEMITVAKSLLFIEVLRHKWGFSTISPLLKPVKFSYQRLIFSQNCLKSHQKSRNYSQNIGDFSKV